MNKHQYPFARIFIRIAIGLALLTILAGAGYTFVGFTTMQTEIQAQKYRPDPELLEKASRMERLYLGTRERIGQTMEDGTLPASVPALDISESLASAARAQGNTQPEILLQLAEQTQTSVTELKEFHVASFERAVESLRQILLQRVIELQKQFGQTDTVAASASPNVQTPEQDAPAKSPASSRFRIFNDQAGNDKSRLRNLEQVRIFLNELREQSQREESLDQIRRAQIFLTRAEAMLDQVQAVVEQPLPGIDATAVASGSSEQQMISRAEELSAELMQMKRIIRQSLYESWQVDDAIGQLRSSARADLSEAESSRGRISAIQSASWSSMGLSFLFSLAVAFMILVLADFLRAFLNLSINSDSFVSVGSGRLTE